MVGKSILGSKVNHLKNRFVILSDWSILILEIFFSIFWDFLIGELQRLLWLTFNIDNYRNWLFCDEHPNMFVEDVPV